MITAVFEGLNPACIGDATTGRLVGVIISSETISVSGLFDEFRAEFGFPSPVEAECDEYGPCGPGEVTAVHVEATVAAVSRASESLGYAADLPWKIPNLFMIWLKVHGTGMVIEDRIRAYVTPCYFSAMQVELDCGDEVDDG